MPRRFGVWFALGLAWLVGDLLRVRRAHVESAMQRAGIAEPARTARAMYRELARGLVELLLLPLRGHPTASLPPEALSRLSSGGAVIATAHTGSWDVVACAVARSGPLTVVTKRLHVGFLDRLWQGIRRGQGVKLVAGPGSARAVARALGRGELVAMIVDQAPERGRAVVRVPFLGAPALVDLAPALCALRAHVPLVAAFPIRSPDGVDTVHLAGVLEPPAVPSRAWAESAMTQVTLWLDELVRRHPEQWLWMHRRWKEHRTLPVSSLAGTG